MNHTLKDAAAQVLENNWKDGFTIPCDGLYPFPVIMRSILPFSRDCEIPETLARKSTPGIKDAFPKTFKP